MLSAEKEKQQQKLHVDDVRVQGLHHLGQLGKSGCLLLTKSFPENPIRK